MSALEKALLEEGYESFNLKDKNDFISYLANKNELKYSDVTDDYILDYHKKLKTAQFNELCERDIINGFTALNGHHYRTNRDDQKNFFGKALELILRPELDEVFWKTEDEGYLAHTRENWLNVYIEGVSHKEYILHKYNTLKAQINDAVTEQEIIDITWE